MKPYRMGYVPALDGLRTLAVLGVIAYHMGFDWMSGGLLGVTVFFVLSGYLITSLLVQELAKTGTIDLPHFWLRRVRRLFPAIVLAICGTAILCGIFDHGLLTKMRPDIVPSLFFFNNWWQIFHDVSYFEAMGAPSPLSHFWSLAIEEQFYLVWPVLLFCLYRFGASRKLLRRITLGLIAASILAMTLLYVPDADPSRVYYGTDTRAFSLLIGAFFAFIWPAAQLRSSTRAAKVSHGVALALDGVGVAALAGLLVMFVCTDGMSAFLYHGGLVLCSLLAAVVIAVVVHPASMLGKVLGWTPLAWVGKRSYAMYLWHYPILLLLRTVFPGEVAPWWFCLIELGLIIGISQLSYVFVENPLRKGALGEACKALWATHSVGQKMEMIRKRYLPAIIGTILVVGGAWVAVTFVPEQEYDENTLRLMEMQEQAESEARQAEIEANIAKTQARIAQLKGDSSEWQLLIIGDSVVLGASETLLERHPDSIVDAAVSRWGGEAVDIYNAYVDEGWQGSAVVFALGINGPLYDSLDQMGEAVGTDIPLFIVNERDPYVEWEASNNEIISEYVATHPNTYLVDWYGASNSHEEYFYDDGTHLNGAGREAYADLLDDTIRSYFPAE